MLSLIMLAGAVAVLWGIQSWRLRHAGLPLTWRLGGGAAADYGPDRVLVNGVLLAVLAVYPLLRGSTPWAYYAKFLPRDTAFAHATWGLSLAVLYLTLLYVAWLITGNVTFELRHRPLRIVTKLAAVPLTAVLVATVEELLFRATLLAELLTQLPAGAAIGVGALVFAGAHYVRAVKRRWTFPGHVALGILLCTAFWCTGNLWLVMGLHAGGVLVLMGVRPFVRYRGPAWLVGASIFPYAGAVGVAALLLLTLNVVVLFGTAQ